MPALLASRSAISSQLSMLFVVGFLWKLGDREIAVLVDDRGLRPPAIKGGAGCEDVPEIFVRFLVAENALGDLQQLPEFDEGRHTGGSAPGKFRSRPSGSEVHPAAQSGTFAQPRFEGPMRCRQSGKRDRRRRRVSAPARSSGPGPAVARVMGYDDLK